MNIVFASASKPLRWALLGWLLLSPGLWTRTTWASEQVLIGGGNLSPQTGAVRETVIQGEAITAGWAATGSLAANPPIPSSGTFNKLRVTLDVAPDTGAGTQTYTFALVIDGSATALTCAISEAATSCADTSNSVAITAGSVASLRATPSGTPATVIPTWTLVFDGSTTAESIYPAGGTGNNVSGRHLPFHGHGGPGESTEALEQLLISTSGTFKNLYIKKTDPGAGNTFVWMVRKNEGDTTLTCTITEGNTACSDLSNSFTVVAGDRVTVLYTATGTPTASNGVRSITFLADTNGEFLFGASNTGNASASADNYVSIQSEGIGWNATETVVDQVGQSMTMTKLQVLLSGTPGAGNNYALNLRQDVASPGLTCTVADTDTTCAGTATITINADDLLATLSTPTSTPSARSMRIGYTGFIAPATGTRRIMLISKEASCDSWLFWRSCPSRN